MQNIQFLSNCLYHIDTFLNCLFANDQTNDYQVSNTILFLIYFEHLFGISLSSHSPLISSLILRNICLIANVNKKLINNVIVVVALGIRCTHKRWSQRCIIVIECCACCSTCGVIDSRLLLLRQRSNVISNVSNFRQRSVDDYSTRIGA